MTNKEETDPTESRIVRASVLESHGWSLISLHDSRTRRTLETLALTLDFSIISFVVNCELQFATRKIAHLSRSDNDDDRQVLFFLS